MLQALWKKEETCIRVTVKPETTKIDRGKKMEWRRGLENRPCKKARIIRPQSCEV